MAVSSKDLESLWQRYTVEAVPAVTIYFSILPAKK